MAHPSTHQVIITFGKFKGSTLGYVAENRPNYLQWIIAQSFDPKWKTAAERALSDQPVDDLDLPRTRQKPPQSPQDQAGQAGIILKNKTTAAVKFPYNDAIVRRIKDEIDGRKWNPKNKCWEFSVVHLPKVVGMFGGPDQIAMTEEVKKKYQKELKRRKDLDDIRDLDDTEIDVSGLKLPLYPFQRVGVKFVDRASGRAMIADQMGLGKTITSIAFALLKQSKTLIVCPKTVVLQWQKEIKKFTGKDATIWGTQSIEGHGNAQFHIINYDAVRKQLDALLERKFDLLVCDEATNLKNRQTLRAKSILGSWKERKEYPGIKTKYILFLTGTPILNRPVEAYYLLNVLDKDRFNNFYHFTRRYGGWKGDKKKRSHDQDESNYYS